MINIRKGRIEDCDAVFNLIFELAVFEKEPDAVENSPEQLRKDGFEQNPPLFELIIAEDDESGICGMAMFYMAYSSWKGKMLYLDDLVVAADMRNKGIGKMLIKALFKYAKEQQVNIVKWEVLDWNTNAIKFYEKLGANFSEEWIHCKFYKNQIKLLAK